VIDRAGILAWLRETDPSRLSRLYRRADAVRREHVGDEVHLRGLVEVSNHCVRRCAYCGIAAPNTGLSRYRMTTDEVLGCARQAKELGYGTVVLQAGEDYGLTRGWVVDLVRSIKSATGLAVTLSLGERPDEDLSAFREAGADRYLLRFETSDPALYEAIHPSLPDRRSDRFAILRRLESLGYEVGSGVLVGIPGQTFESLASDLLLFRDLDLDMIGVGPYIPHPATPLGAGLFPRAPEGEQVPADEETTTKVVALARLVRPDANIPSTTALATLEPSFGRERGLLRGANVVMPNLTPPAYRALYEIYPGKACISETAEACGSCLPVRIRMIGRTPGTGPGARRSATSPVALQPVIA
jgi:biotin synthase